MKPNLLFAAAVLGTIISIRASPLQVLAWDEAVAQRKLAISHSKGTEPLMDLHPFQRSKVFQVTPSKEAPAFILALDQKDAEGNPAKVDIVIPEGIQKPLLILLPDKKAPSGLRPIILDDDLAGFSWGSIRLVNATGKKLVFKWEKKLMALPETWTPTQVSPGGENRNMQVQLFLHDTPDPPLYSSVWEHRSHYRNLIFIMPGDDPRLGPVTFKYITEDRRVAEAENAAAKAK